MNGFRRNGIRYNGYKQAEKCDFVFVVCVYGANLRVGVCMSMGPSIRHAENGEN